MPICRITAAALVILFYCCVSFEDSAEERQEPDHFPELEIPTDNLILESRVALGRKLFFDRNISLDSSIACVDCHIPKYALADTTALSDGVGARLGQRNAPSLYNVGYLDLINKDGGVARLDLQALVPIEDEHEMALPVLQLQKRLEHDAEYVNMAEVAYQRQPDAYTITRSLATFLRTLFSADAPYDRFIQGDSAALSQEARAGMKLFKSERLGCQSCHSGILFTNNEFANNGLYQEYSDLGRALITMDSADIGKFRIPSLRNVELTAPYMHDGSLSTLDAVIDHYIHTAPTSEKSTDARVKQFQLSQTEQLALKSFLHSLTGASANQPI